MLPSMEHIGFEMAVKVIQSIFFKGRHPAVPPSVTPGPGEDQTAEKNHHRHPHPHLQGKPKTNIRTLNSLPKGLPVLLCLPLMPSPIMSCFQHVLVHLNPRTHYTSECAISMKTILIIKQQGTALV